MSTTGHWLPLLATLLVWFASTGLIAWLDNRPRATFARSLAVGGLAGAGGLLAIVLTRADDGVLAAYLSFAGGLAIWGWLEMAFLMGAITGPRRGDCPAGARGWPRFRYALETMLHHELAVAATGLLLLSLAWGAADPVGAQAFALLYVMRLSAKLNIFAGVPSFSDEMLPPHLTYLRTYFGARRSRPALYLSILAALALTLWLGARALALPGESGAAVGASLLFGLAALGLLEHAFLALPLRDGALWKWAVPDRAI